MENLCFDLKEPFNTNRHKLSLKMRAHYGIRGACNDCCISYLQHQSQYAPLNGFDSGCRHSKCGVHKGSLLGTFLFGIHINDLNFVMLFCWLYQERPKVFFQ